jgi:hypothetical protein
LLWILGAGLVASALAAALFAIARAYHLTRFSLAEHLGCLLVEDPRHPMAETAGAALHLALGSTVVAGIYALVLPWLGGPGWGSGALLGLVHGGAVVATLPVLARINRAVRAGRLPQPGRFGTGWGRYTAHVVIAGAVCYGAVAGAILGAARARPDANLAQTYHSASQHVALAGHRPLQN